MNKKILYAIFFTSLFLLSTASMVQPVRGYETGIPAEAKGHTVEGEVKIFDEDEWEDHLGGGIDPDDLHAGDADVVGAKSQYTILDWEEDEINYFKDFLMPIELEVIMGGAPLPIENFGELASFIDLLTTAFANNSVSLAILAAVGFDAMGLIKIAQAVTYTLNDTLGENFGFGGPWNTTLSNGLISASTAQGVAWAGTPDEAESVGLFGEKFDGTILTRDLWDFSDEEFKAKPDEKEDEVPFLHDPRDWYDAWKGLDAWRDKIVATMTSIVSALDGWFVNINATLADNPLGWGPGPTPPLHPYCAFNATLHAAGATPLIGVPRNLTKIDAAYPDAKYDNVYGLYATLKYYLDTGVKVGLAGLVPEKTEFLFGLMKEGQPAMQPADDFLARALEEFDFDDDGEVETWDLYLPAVPVTVEVDLDGDVMTFEFEYADNAVDPYDVAKGKSDPDDLDDFEVVFGATEQWKDGNTIFYEKGDIDAIPGFEVSIILGASAVAILGLIYVVMKKRKM